MARRTRVRLALLGLPVLAACAGAPARTGAPAAPAPPTAPAAQGATAAVLPKELHWSRDAAEHDALFAQVYRAATERVDRLAAGLPAGGWAVILDADETVLDNSPYYREQSAGKLTQPPYDAAGFEAWARRGEAPALPGAAAFITHVNAMGGRAVIVTNRVAAVCDATRENFRRLSLPVAAVLCRPAETGDKNPRFAAVQAGTTGAGLPALRVLVWVGDNILDFPGLTQDVRRQGEAGTADFGSRFFLLPNPMYGSWEQNPPR